GLDGVSIGLLATLLIAPLTTEFAAKVAVLGALALVCGARPLVELALSAARSSRNGALARATAFVRGNGSGAGFASRATTTVIALAGTAGFVGLVVLADVPSGPSARVASAPPADPRELPEVTVVASTGVATQIDRSTALQIASDVVADLRIQAEALLQRDVARAAEGADGAWLAGLEQQIIETAGGTILVPAYDVERMRVTLEPGERQGPPKIVCFLEGTVVLETYTGSPPALELRAEPVAFEQTLEVALENGRFVIVRSRDATSEVPLTPSVVEPPPSPPATVAGGSGLGGVQLADVAPSVGLDFRHGAFRFRVSRDPVAMMGGGLCWLDYDGDGWLDLYVVNSYSIELDVARWKEQGGLPRSALFRNSHGRFRAADPGSGADLAVRGNGCVAADFNGDSRTDLYVTAAGYDALLWNSADGTFVEGARAAGITGYGWHTGAAVGDVNGDARPDLFVSGYTDLNAPVPGSIEGFPTSHAGVRDLLYLNEGTDENGRSTFREVGAQAGLDAGEFDHSLGAVFTDFNDDGRLDLYVANDMDPNRLYENLALPAAGRAGPAALGFRFEEVSGSEAVADTNAGMGIAVADYGTDGRPDLFVTNARDQTHAVYRSRPPESNGPAFADVRSDLVSAFGTSYTGWGVSFADLDLDGNLDLVIANGAIPVTNLAEDAEPIQVLENLFDREGRFADAGAVVAQRENLDRNGRGLASADYDNDGDVDLAVNSIGGSLVLLQNGGATGNWLEVKLSTFSPGARVTAVLPDGRRLVREVQAGSSYLSSEDPRVHFGLGDVTKVTELLVRFPDGSESRLTNVAANRMVEL
ncbi:MAG: CRTAC1 family protein, partial [Actinobacteria bacterium]|nr:CRTAC1 family protein [Actinomycetota bacterium]